MLKIIYHAVPFGIWAALFILAVMTSWIVVTALLVFWLGDDDDEDE